jgi:hypothetical protein
MRTNLLLAAAALAALAGAGWYFYNQATRALPADLGVPVYPGARFTDTVTVGTTRAVTLETADAPERVIAFYKEKLEGRSRVLEREVGGERGAIITVKVDGREKVVTVTRDSSRAVTQIAIATRGEH